MRSARASIAILLLAAAPVLAQGGIRKDAASPSAPMQSARSRVTVRWLGHATFEVASASGTRILIDPFVTGNPATPDSLKSLGRYSGAWRPNAILVSHAHDDHSADARAIAQASGAPVISAYEWASTLGLPQAQVMGGNVGGTFTVGDIVVHVVPAMHSSEPGRALGFVLEFPGGRTLYHTGDTWIFGDMALIQERYRPSIVLMGVGGGPYTQDPRDAALALRKWFSPQVVVPMHFGTFPGLATEAQVRAALPSATVMRVGETRTF